MKLKETEIKEYSNTKDFNSSAISLISLLDNNQVKIVFNNTSKEYIYDIIDNNFIESLDNVIQNKESVGQFVVRAIKNENLQQININVQ